MAQRPRAKRLTDEQRVTLVEEAIQLRQANVSQRDIAAQLGVSQPTVCTWLRKMDLGVPLTVRGRVAAQLRAELVCCDVYERYENLHGDTAAQEALMNSSRWHHICFYGEWAARIAEKTA